jgi:hypothetical protein
MIQLEINLEYLSISFKSKYAIIHLDIDIKIKEGAVVIHKTK